MEELVMFILHLIVRIVIGLVGLALTFLWWFL